jgi:large subunit ribosomal protein L29|tara:strand:+ start:303 stop:506 length:204 start_codon:yes stop_codon:yes gene_type:complete
MAKKKNINQMSIDELKKELNDLNDSMMNFRFQKSLQQLEHPQKISQNRKNIARIKTFIRQFELGLKK